MKKACFSKTVCKLKKNATRVKYIWPRLRYANIVICPCQSKDLLRTPEFKLKKFISFILFKNSCLQQCKQLVSRDFIFLMINSTATIFTLFPSQQSFNLYNYFFRAARRWSLILFIKQLWPFLRLLCKKTRFDMKKIVCNGFR